ncbi:MAG: squalene--hopene cyclase, partial [Opitutales bacterium]|nr:squalene--hopene cyclase [Opitutales bacterium]
KVEPSGWSFQRSNVYYPDIDDTAVAMLALKKFKRLLPSYDQRAARIDAALRRAANWIIAMQSKNGAWAAFDRDNTKAIITKLPFCDFGEVLDPPSSDVTAHVIEALVNCGYDRKHPVLQRALEFLYKEQESDGSWFGRWGINYIYGTWCVLTALAAAGDTKQDEHIKRALNWIYSRQNRDGGWGESAASYMTPLSAGEDAKSTASQTAWALIALLNFEDKLNPAIKRGIEFLKSTQLEDGSWYENEFTGTGFPGYGLGAKVDLRAGKPLPQGKELSRGFMLRYGYYCQYFPIVALSLAKKTQA